MANLTADIETLSSWAGEIKDDLLKPPAGILRRPYLTAGPGGYANLIDWDAVWGGMSYLIDGDPEPLRNSLLNLLEHIGPGGKGQRVIKPDGYGAPVFQNRPFLATGIFVLSRELGSCDWLPHDGWKKLRSYLIYRHVHHLGRHGLLKWLSVDEGFADNGLANWAWDSNSVEAVDLNAQMVLEHSAAAWVAGRIGRKEHALEHQQLAQGLQDRIQQILWNEEQGFYFSSYNPQERYQMPYPIKCLHYTNLWPLWLGLAPEERGRRVIETYMLNPDHFWSDFGIRSMARSDIAYNNAIRGITIPMTTDRAVGPGIGYRCSNMQGPIWSIVNYQAVLALKRYGYEREAREVTERVLRLFANSVREHGTCYENYDAETGRALCVPNVGSWNLMLHHLPQDISADLPWMLKGLTLPTARYQN